MKIQDVLNKITSLQTQILRFGIQQLTSSSRPSSPGLGQVIYEQDTSKLKVFTGVEWNPCSAGGELGYAQVTSNQGSITTQTDLTSLTKAVTVGTNRRIRITGCGLFSNNTISDGANLFIMEGATQLQQANGAITVANNSATIIAQVVLTPTAGSHTYKLQGSNQTGGTAQLNASATFPAFIEIEDIGPA